MRKVLVLISVGALGIGGVGAAQQPQAEYLIDARVLAGNPQDTGSIQLVASPTFRTRAGRPASMDLSDRADGLRLVVTPSDLGGGRVAIRVVVESRTAGRTQGSSFDVVTGMGLTVPTVAPRDAAGGFLLAKDDRPIFIEIRAAAPKYRLR